MLTAFYAGAAICLLLLNLVEDWQPKTRTGRLLQVAIGVCVIGAFVSAVGRS